MQHGKSTLILSTSNSAAMAHRWEKQPVIDIYSSLALSFTRWKVSALFTQLCTLERTSARQLKDVAGIFFLKPNKDRCEWHSRAQIPETLEYFSHTVPPHTSLLSIFAQSKTWNNLRLWKYKFSWIFFNIKCSSYQE